MHIHGRHVGTDEPAIDGRIALVTILKNGHEQRRVEQLDFRPSARAFAPPIRKVGVLGKYCRERFGVMPVPRVHEPVYHRNDRLLFCFAFRLAAHDQRQSGEGNRQTGQQKSPSESCVSHDALLFRVGYDVLTSARTHLRESAEISGSSWMFLRFLSAGCSKPKVGLKRRAKCATWITESWWFDPLRSTTNMLRL